jgi:hypothetical protein
MQMLSHFIKGIYQEILAEILKRKHSGTIPEQQCPIIGQI